MRLARLYRSVGLGSLTFALALGLLLIAGSAAEAQDRAALAKARHEMKVAERLVRTGAIEDGMTRMREVMQSFPKEPRFLQQYAAQLRRQDRLDEAIVLYEDRIRDKDAPSFLLQELEGMYRESSRLSDAFDLCLVYESRQDKAKVARGKWVIRELESIILTRELGEEAVEKLDQALKQRKANSTLYAVRLMAIYFAGDSEKALQEAASLDKKRKARGDELFSYAAMVETRGEMDDAVQVLELLMRSTDREPLRERVVLKRARLLRKLRRLDDAIVANREFLAAYPKSGAYLDVLRTNAAILDKEQGRTSEALVAYEGILEHVTPIRKAADIKVANQTQLAMANCHLLLGNPEEAGGLYQKMADEATDPGVRVEALYEVAEMLFFQGLADEAETKYYEIVDTFPTSTWVNDALDRILLIGENNDMDGVPLAALAQAEFYNRMGDVQKGIALLVDAEKSFPHSEATDNVMFNEIELRLAVGEVRVAAIRADSLAERYPESVLAPRALLRIADYYRDTSGGKPTAKKIYTEILLRFPDALEIPDVRSGLERLDGNKTDSSGLIWDEYTQGRWIAPRMEGCG